MLSVDMDTFLRAKENEKREAEYLLIVCLPCINYPKLLDANISIFVSASSEKIMLQNQQQLTEAWFD